MSLAEPRKRDYRDLVIEDLATDLHHTRAELDACRGLLQERFLDREIVYASFAALYEKESDNRRLRARVRELQALLRVPSRKEAA